MKNKVIGDLSLIPCLLKEVSPLMNEHGSTHHRRCSSLDPALIHNKENLSNVGQEKHNNYHAIFHNKNIYQIAEMINNFPTEIKPKSLKVIVVYIKGSKVVKRGIENGFKIDKIIKAWKSLMRGRRSFKKQIDFLNEVWIDPSYRLVILRQKNNYCEGEKIKKDNYADYDFERKGRLVSFLETKPKSYLYFFVIKSLKTNEFMHNLVAEISEKFKLEVIKKEEINLVCDIIFRFLNKRY